MWGGAALGMAWEQQVVHAEQLDWGRVTEGRNYTTIQNEETLSKSDGCPTRQVLTPREKERKT